MPRAPRPCAAYGCPAPATSRGRCAGHARRQGANARPNATDRGYDATWRKTRARYLARHWTCECDDCLALPVNYRPDATDVHHRDGLGPLGPLGHAPENLQAMTHGHHSRVTARDQSVVSIAATTATPGHRVADLVGDAPRGEPVSGRAFGRSGPVGA